MPTHRLRPSARTGRASGRRSLARRNRRSSDRSRSSSPSGMTGSANTKDARSSRAGGAAREASTGSSRSRRVQSARPRPRQDSRAGAAAGAAAVSAPGVRQTPARTKPGEASGRDHPRHVSRANRRSLATPSSHGRHGRRDSRRDDRPARIGDPIQHRPRMGHRLDPDRRGRGVIPPAVAGVGDAAGDRARTGRRPVEAHRHHPPSLALARNCGGIE
jgi:hypothetical protein